MSVSDFTTRAIILVCTGKYGYAKSAFDEIALRQGVLADHLAVQNHVGVMIVHDQCKISLQRIVELYRSSSAGFPNAEPMAEFCSQVEDLGPVQEY